MSVFKKSPAYGVSKHSSPAPRLPVNNAYTNPFDSDEVLDIEQPLKTLGRASSEPPLFKSDVSTNPFDDGVNKSISFAHSYISPADIKKGYKNDFRDDSGGPENQTVEELENYAVYKAEETTKRVNSCLKIAEDIREDATKTLVTLHQQGEQITRTHTVAADIEQSLSRGEKILGTLGGIFSRTWKPMMSRQITGPIITKDNLVQRNGNQLEQRGGLGLSSASKERLRTRTPPPEPTNSLQTVEVEKVKQDDVLSDLSNLLGELKDMAIDMGSEIDRQNKALDHVQDDVDELNFRVKGANQRARRLLGK